MIHGCVEDAASCVVVGLDLDARQLSVPLVVNLAYGSVEVPSRHLGVHIGLGFVGFDGRESHLHEQRLVRIVERKECAVHRVGTFNVYGARKVHGEIDAAVLGPTRRAAITNKSCGRLLRQHAVGRSVPADALCQVESQLSLGTLAERIAVHGATLRSGQFDEHVGVGKAQRVVAGMHALVVVSEESGALVGVAHGQQSDVAEASDARSREVHVAESDYLVVAIVIARSPVPSAQRLGRTHDDESEGSVCAHNGMAVSSSSDVLVDVLREIVICSVGVLYCRT